MGKVSTLEGEIVKLADLVAYVNTTPMMLSGQGLSKKSTYRRRP